METPLQMEGSRTFANWGLDVVKNAYISVSIAQEHRKYLRSILDRKMYEFILDLQFSSHVYKAPVTSNGTLADTGTHINFILIMYQFREGLLLQMEMTTQLLESLGFTISREKSQLVLSQQIQFLGFQVR